MVMGFKLNHSTDKGLYFILIFLNTALSKTSILVMLDISIVDHRVLLGRLEKVLGWFKTHVEGMVGLHALYQSFLFFSW